jgi:UDP-N-acetylmuramate: L-alanyl-gamma-D-glutamyl-meso-diaminopimelate ligase
VLEKTLNRIPERVDSVHLIAVCGTAMAALAALLKDRGIRVTGSDQNIYPPMSTFLESRGIRILSGYAPENLHHRPDLVVVGNAVTRANPEAVALAALKLPYCSMPQALNHFAAGGKKTLMMAGTHGKTTTSSITAWLLESAGLGPSFMIGGILNNFGSNYRLGSGEHFVVEGDEYDTAFFDKEPKFFHYRPDSLIITGIEFDHADIFTDLGHIRSKFQRLIQGLPADSLLVARAGDDTLGPLLKEAPCRVDTFGETHGAVWTLGRVAIEAPQTVFEVVREGRSFGRFRSPLPGDHNLMNAVAAIAVADRAGLSVADIAAGLANFRGIKRRQEIRGVASGITVMDDFAHHPTAVAETVRALRPFYPDGRLLAVFEPRTNTSMRKIFQTAYVSAFDHADIVCIREPSALAKVPEGERLSTSRLVADIEARGIRARYFEDTGGIVAYLAEEARTGDLVLVMSNGGFDNIHERLLTAFSER